MLSRWKNHSWNFYFLLIVFVSMFIFFTSVHCLIIYDGDDWVNLSQMRLFVPMWRGFNPIKILPETLMPLVGYLSGYAITPITKNYVAAVTLLSALLVSGFITLYMYLQHFTTFTLPRKLMKLVYTRPELSPLDFLRFGP